MHSGQKFRLHCFLHEKYSGHFGIYLPDYLKIRSKHHHGCSVSTINFRMDKSIPICISKSQVNRQQIKPLQYYKISLHLLRLPDLIFYDYPKPGLKYEKPTNYNIDYLIFIKYLD